MEISGSQAKSSVSLIRAGYWWFSANVTARLLLVCPRAAVATVVVVSHLSPLL